MSNGVITLDPMSGGVDIDAESLLVDSNPVLRERVEITGAAELEIAAVKAAAIAADSYGLGVRPIIGRSAITALHTAQVLDDSPTEADSSTQAVDQYREAILYVHVVRSSSPAEKLRIVPQYSDDDGTTWFTAEDQVREISDMTIIPTSGGYYITLHLPILGRDCRLKIQGIGTTSTQTFTVTVTTEYIV
jgi:hypothetical protein